MKKKARDGYTAEMEAHGATVGSRRKETLTLQSTMIPEWDYSVRVSSKGQFQLLYSFGLASGGQKHPY
jgi:hypothetical protein